MQATLLKLMRVNMLRDCYRADRTMSVATTDLLNRIFGTYGLVILDGDHPAMKKACADIILDELQSRELSRYSSACI